MILERIPQRARHDCTVCAVAMVLGYTYERVATDRATLTHFGDNVAWWEHYLADEGRHNDYRPLADISVVQATGAPVVGLLGMQSDQRQAGHLAAIDEVGVLDPSDGFPEHTPWSAYRAVKRAQSFLLDSEFLAVSIPTRPNLRRPAP